MCIAFRHHASWVAGFSRNPFIVLDHIGIVLNASIQPGHINSIDSAVAGQLSRLYGGCLDCALCADES